MSEGDCFESTPMWLFVLSAQSVKRGYLRVTSKLLDYGCNYNSPTREDLCAANFAKNYQQRDLLRLLNTHRDRSVWLPAARPAATAQHAPRQVSVDASW